ncbi:hypothetical protein CDD81_142 [Ophiocordyceps australis]|uniref:CSC1/OSCA1-like 7TM region domain-containing protein n=1 Tax=Ophiocordyceps australis TaxID=1399860 RepID=A0A2C5YK34_9HYPO|nr:hypothetical protein CDD81_142 [Ophiocordyceps australis]
MAETWAIEARGILDIFKGGNDPRVGSGRQDSSGGGTLSTASGSKSSSLGKLGATFIPVVIYLAICIVAFTVLRRRFPRVYAPRSIPALRAPEKSSPALPSGWLNWIVPFFKIPDTFLLAHGTLDAFFFLRFLKVLRNVCLGGCVILWPVLFPIHATGGGGLSELDLLTIGNVKDSSKLYAHAAMAWVFFGFVLYMIVRECIFYVNLRQTIMSSPSYARRLSSRTMLLTSVPSEYLSERRLRKLYGPSVRRVFIPSTTKALAKLVKEREQTATRLERAEVELILRANAARKKHLKKAAKSGSNDVTTTDSAASQQNLVTLSRDGTVGPLVLELPGSYIEIEPLREKAKTGGDSAALDIGTSPQEAEKANEDEDPDYIHPYGLEFYLPDVRGSVAARWLPVEKRPYHRPLGNFGRRVDTIRWTRLRLRELNNHIHRMRRRIRRGDSGTTLPVAFIEFESQEAAQAAHQVLPHHRPLRMAERIIGVVPGEVIWSSLRMSWWERIGRRFMILSLVTAAVVFWSVPSALIGLVSQIDFLAKKVVFLSWIKRLPSIVVNFLQGFVPSIALSLLMSLVPVMLRVCGAQAGISSVIKVELFVQNVYFAFQVVQVFLITTITSAASAALTDILQNPIKVKDVLATNLPMASNFYLSYILVQCVVSSGTNLLQVFSLIRHTVHAKFTKLPRARLVAWRRLRSPRWGGVFPVFANMGVIALSYACIAPLILIFAAGGMAIIRIVWRYNVIFVMDSSSDSKGLFYPRALLHLTIGLYLAEICLIGLFALHLAFGPLAMMVLFFLFTGLVHVSLRDAIQPLLQNLPQTLAMEEDVQREDKEAAELARRQAAARTSEEAAAATGAASSYYDANQVFGEEEEEGFGGHQDWNTDGETEDEEEGAEHGPVTGTRALEGASSVRSAVGEWFKMSTKSKIRDQALQLGLPKVFAKFRTWAGLDGRDSGRPPGLLARWLHPEEYEDFVALRRTLLLEEEDVGDSEQVSKTSRGSKSKSKKLMGYLPPETWMPRPTLWIPRDEARVSRQEVAHTRKVTPISDKGAYLDGKGRIVVHFDEAPFTDERDP